MGTLLKLAVLGAALVACLFVFPVWFPKLTTVCFSVGQTPVSWGLVLAVGLIGGGAFILKAK
jgi:hypothetical protein